MTENGTAPTVEAPAEEKTEKVLSKAEQRIKEKNEQYLERLQKEATHTHNMMCARFTDFLILCDDPSEEILRERAKQLSAQWKMFCKQKNLKYTVLNLVGDFCDKTIAEFIALQQEAPKETIPTQESVIESAKEDKLI